MDEDLKKRIDSLVYGLTALFSIIALFSLDLKLFVGLLVFLVVYRSLVEKPDKREIRNTTIALAILIIIGITWFWLFPEITLPSIHETTIRSASTGV